MVRTDWDDTPEEKAFIEQIENGEIEPMDHNSDEFKELKAQLEMAAKNPPLIHTEEDYEITINVQENDLDNIKRMASEEGLSFHAFLTTMIHKIASGQLKAC